ncbi:PilZ domain-containing protein, partial [Candidatus Omnitrophota bacterium]
GENMAQEFSERRRFIRLNSVFPVEFSLYFTPKKSASDIYQGFTHDVSEGGLCLKVRNLKSEDEHFIIYKRAGLRLKINLPLRHDPIYANAEIAWASKDKSDPMQSTYLIGLSYKQIGAMDKKRIINYARRLKWLPRIVYTGFVILLAGFIILAGYHIKARRDNKILLDKLVSVSEIKSNLEKGLNEKRVRIEMLESKSISSSQQIESLKSQIAGVRTKTGSESQRLKSSLKEALTQQEELQLSLAKVSKERLIVQDIARERIENQLSEINARIDLFQVELAQVGKKGRTQIDALEEKIRFLESENLVLKDDIVLARQGELTLEEELANIRFNNTDLEKSSVDNIIEWIRSHQVSKTGLVLSFEGDEKLKDYGFTYDQALACQLFLLTGDSNRAKSVLDFYKSDAENEKGLFYNAYDVKTSTPIEYNVCTGPNIWLGLSICQYTKQTKDKQFLPIAERIASNVIKLQAGSDDGGIKGGPKLSWVSTEHNLDAYAFFNMLFKLTGEEKYKDSTALSYLWLSEVGYDSSEGRFLRGRGDSTIATDTFSWAIASIGPAKLKADGMDPDGIMEFAEKECRVETIFQRPDKKSVKVVGFDFSKPENIARNGVISTEWTAQMIVAFKIMADYYKEEGYIDKEKIYRSKAEYYLAQLSKMAISSLSPTGRGKGCFPYASKANINTGHGFRVAAGDRTGSVAATIYYLFAYYGYNPLSFE